ncbi:MAG: hypothetical protein AB8G99_26570 [Planctomycetaceae bacterium]
MSPAQGTCEIVLLIEERSRQFLQIESIVVHLLVPLAHEDHFASSEDA